METSSLGHASRHGSVSMTLLGLDTLPCGCVAGVYRTRPTAIEVEFVEAKGPHCVFSLHRTGQMTRLGAAESLTLEMSEPLA